MSNDPKVTQQGASEHPLHEKLARIKDLSQECGEFLDWLLEKRYVLAKYHEHSNCSIDFMQGKLMMMRLGLERFGPEMEGSPMFQPAVNSALEKLPPKARVRLSEVGNVLQHSLGNRSDSRTNSCGGNTGRETDADGWDQEFSNGCRFYMPLPGNLGFDWGVCTNPKSHRVGLLTWEQQGCFELSYSGE